MSSIRHSLLPIRHMSFLLSGPLGPMDTENESNQADRTISTGKLHALLHFHTQPINLVVYEGPLGGSSPQGNLILGWASRLDAFSGYPFRT